MKRVAVVMAIVAAGTGNGHAQAPAADQGMLTKLANRTFLVYTGKEFVRLTFQPGSVESPLGGIQAGVQVPAAKDTPVRAVADGTVQFSGGKSVHGNVVELRYADGAQARYAHLNMIAAGIREGARVKRGQVIGTVGITGRTAQYHLAYTLTMAGDAFNTMALVRNGEALYAVDDPARRSAADMPKSDCAGRLQLFANGSYDSCGGVSTYQLMLTDGDFEIRVLDRRSGSAVYHRYLAADMSRTYPAERSRAGFRSSAGPDASPVPQQLYDEVHARPSAFLHPIEGQPAQMASSAPTTAAISAPISAPPPSPSATVAAQDSAVPPATPARMPAGPRVALIVANGRYGASLGALTNPANDAQIVAEGLRKAGFDVELVADVNQRGMKAAIARFGQRLVTAGRTATGLFYYAGHGVQTGGTNYLVPVDAAIEKEADVDLDAIPADTILRQMEGAGISTSILILDACRNMPFARASRSASRGLARMDAPNGSYVAYSTAPGQVAADGSGRNSPFAAAFVREMAKGGLPIELVFRNVRKAVSDATAGQQTPWDSSSLMDDFIFMQK